MRMREREQRREAAPEKVHSHLMHALRAHCEVKILLAASQIMDQCIS